jgi:hypothetical protein
MPAIDSSTSRNAYKVCTHPYICTSQFAAGYLSDASQSKALSPFTTFMQSSDILLQRFNMMLKSSIQQQRSLHHPEPKYTTSIKQLCIKRGWLQS